MYFTACEVSDVEMVDDANARWIFVVTRRVAKIELTANLLMHLFVDYHSAKIHRCMFIGLTVYYNAYTEYNNGEH